MIREIVIDKSSLIEEAEAFLAELNAIESKKEVLARRADGKTIREIAMSFGITDERIRGIEAKIARKFAMSQRGRSIISALSALSEANPELTTDDLREFFGEHHDAVIYLLRLYKNSHFYNGKLEFIG